ENAEGRCIAFSEEICLFLGGTVVSKCNETPIAHTPNPIPYTPAAPHYYSLKGTFLGTQKPTAPGVYIEVRAENFQPQQQRARKIMVK
ncbi:MAG: hypothetical protein FWC26_06670, partial [Fibromonadales bacterium]|nr:hypothetical protein [Fibromonadales bacterium]